MVFPEMAATLVCCKIGSMHLKFILAARQYLTDIDKIATS